MKTLKTLALVTLALGTYATYSAAHLLARHVGLSVAYRVALCRQCDEQLALIEDMMSC